MNSNDEPIQGPGPSPKLTTKVVGGLALMTSLGLSGYLIVKAQRRANPGAAATEKETETPSVVDPGSPEEIDPTFLSTSKSFFPAPVPFPTAPWEPKVDPTFIYSSKMISPEALMVLEEAGSTDEEPDQTEQPGQTGQADAQPPPRR